MLMSNMLQTAGAQCLLTAAPGDVTTSQLEVSLPPFKPFQPRSCQYYYFQIVCASGKRSSVVLSHSIDSD